MMRYNKENKCLENVLCGRRYNMDYKKEIIEMIENMHNEKILNLIFWFVKRGYNEERARK